MSCYVKGQRMPDQYKPELYEEEDLVEIVNQMYHDCLDKGCENCPFYRNNDNENCQMDILMELYRRWQNLKNILDEAIVEE